MYNKQFFLFTINSLCSKELVLIGIFPVKLSNDRVLPPQLSLFSIDDRLLEDTPSGMGYCPLDSQNKLLLLCFGAGGIDIKWSALLYIFLFFKSTVIFVRFPESEASLAFLSSIDESDDFRNADAYILSLYLRTKSQTIECFEITFTYGRRYISIQKHTQKEGTACYR